MSVADPVLSSYLWLVVVGALAAFAFGFGTGSNDVANAFGTSVGAKTLTLKQAVVIAAIFEFTGAMVLGRVSTSTIAGGIADINAFSREPEVFAYGMVCALSTSAIWQVVASYLELNVSSTHSIIGAIIGFSLAYNGSSAVKWQTPDPSSFPPFKGVVPIVVSWFFSPVFTAIVAAGLMFAIRSTVLRRQNSYALSFWLLPIFVTFTVFVCLYFVFTKGAKKTFQSDGGDEWTDAKAAWIAAASAAGAGVLVAAVLLPILKSRAGKRFNDDGTLREERPTADAEAGKVEIEMQESSEGEAAAGAAESGWKSTLSKSFKKVKEVVTHGTTVDVHAVVEEDELVNAIHANAEVFDPKAEYAFQYLQVFSAICVVFAHGAGEVGYMAGPLATVWAVYTEGKLTKDVTAPAWVVLIGAVGLVIGLATYGYNVTRAMGVRLSKLSPTRGFCAELSTALVIMIASQYGLPTSSSQCITGGIIGVGLLEGKVGVNWTFLARQFSSWVGTLFIVGISTAALFAQGLYAPGKISGAAQVNYEDRVAKVTTSMIDNYRLTLDSYRAAATAGVLGNRLSLDQLNRWNNTLGKISTTVNNMVTKDGSVDSNVLMNYLNTALSLYQNDTVLTVGQVQVFAGSAMCNSNDTAQINQGTLVECPAPKLVPSNSDLAVRL